ncbi:hypothetical protein [Halonotius roseus]|uniref:Uncharacterized protein n=1 Tax=Halonotius roseus TaxID=2511997 RepID=A0A544QR08_9EURY|nr:hypothetical protein [Halonotius roseus]TQQ81874.1 hypothetical protein EWF95_02750 [Halonotius roseus]
MRKIHRLQVLESGYCIQEIPDRDVPNSEAVKNWSVKFYQSNERRDFKTGDITGGTIPGLHKYRYSLEWEPTPETELLEMRNGNSGGTKIRGEKFIGTHDPRLPDYAPVSTTVPWTPTEITAMFNGERVPDRVNYGHNPPMIEAKTARQTYRELIDTAAKIGLEECEAKLIEFENNCDHDHTIESESEYGDVGFCEDCGKSWIDTSEMEADDVTIVGSTA